MAGDRRSLRRDTLHEVAVPTKSPNVVVENLESGAVEIGSQPFPGNCHADTCSHALPQGTGRSLHSSRDAVFGMSGGFTVELAKVLQVVNRQRGLGENVAVFIRSAHTR